jgi:CubicO group peptidase (beta-lactamase class C family)
VNDLGRQLDTWDAPFAAAAVISAGQVAESAGDLDRVVPIASISKAVLTLALLVALEEGALDLDAKAGPPGAAVHDLFAHCSGLDFDTDRVVAPPRSRRVYSNTGWEALCAHLESTTGMKWSRYLDEAVLGPLGMTSTTTEGSPAKDLASSVTDVSRLATELLAPTLIAAETLDTATSVQFPDLGGVLPGVGRFQPLQWGLGFELRGTKHPHWTGTTNGPATFGHFGGSGTFVWVERDRGLALLALTTRDFGPWALAAWPRFSDNVIARFG